MSLIIGTGKKPFVWNNAIEVEYSGSVMEDCQISMNNTFTKTLSKKTIAVFGDYTIYILYSSIKRERKTKYYTKSKGNTFYDIIPYEIAQHDYKPVGKADIKVNAEFLFQPSCEYDFEVAQKAGFICAYWKIRHSGEININLSIDEANEAPAAIGDVKNGSAADKIDNSADSGAASKPSTGTKVWRINQGLNIPAAALLEMDLNQLERYSE